MKHVSRWVSLIIVAIALLSSAMTALAAGPEQWQTVKGTYARADNSQYSSGILRLMYLDNDCTLFEFKHLNGSESENSAINFSFSGVMLSGDDGSAVYESVVDDYNLRLIFDMDADTVTVTQEGPLPVDLSGTYIFQEQSIEVSDETAKEILEFIAPVATSLNHNNGEYNLTYAEEMVGNWFYDIKANFTDTNALISEFWIARDMSAVYRVDTEEPILIFGSAQPMMDADYIVTPSEDAGQDVQLEDGTKSDTADNEPYSVSYVTAALEKEAAAIGDSVKIVITSPGNLPYILEVSSSDSAIADVSNDGVITAKSAGIATITVKLGIDDAAKTFELPFSVIQSADGNTHQDGAPSDSKDNDTAPNGGGSSISVNTIVILIIIVALAAGAVTGAVLLIRHQAKKRGTRF
jgi:hypothetical protein